MKAAVGVVAMVILAACSREPEPVAETAPPETTTTMSVQEVKRKPVATKPAGPTPSNTTIVGGRKLRPIDEAGTDPTFTAYRNRLFEAVRNRDKEELYKLLDPNIKSSFGGGGGIADFEKQWQPDAPDTKLWETLETLLALGGSFRGQHFWMPYVYSSWPQDVDAFENLAVIGPSVSLYAESGGSGPVVATLEYDIVKAASANTPGLMSWRKVETADERKGWVENRYLRSPVDYRAGFAKVGGEWKMQVLVAGD